jgi:Na+:H+ antiporter, NhaA family
MPFRHPATKLAILMNRFLGGAAGSGTLLILVALAAVVIASSPLGETYHGFFNDPLPWTPVAKLNTWHLWINDGLMAVFFFVVGLEIKRELIAGELSTPQKRRLPIVAAIAGMAVPALCYLLIVGREPGLAAGWAIPAATDIAFAIGVLALLGSRLPACLRLFLLSVAIVDDLGAVAIIALFYTAQIKLIWLGAAALGLAALFAMNRAHVHRPLPYMIVAIAVWYCVLHSGVHATIAGVLAALTIPIKLDGGVDSLLLRMEHALVPWNAYFIVPLFGFANAGVSLTGLGTEALFAPLPMAIAIGLIVGKQVGIVGAVFAAEKLGFAERPMGASWLQVWGLAVLCGIGFTMSLFIGALAFPGSPLLVEEAKFGVLAGSLVSAVLGYLILRLAPPQASA